MNAHSVPPQKVNAKPHVAKINGWWRVSIWNEQMTLDRWYDAMTFAKLRNEEIAFGMAMPH